MQVLIAEDDSTSRIILQNMLTNWDYEVTVVADGNQAWEILLRPNAPNLVLLDWMMPGMSGPDICRKIKAEKRMDPQYIILLTAKDEHGDIVKGLESGADDYISKPYNREELRARLAAGKRIVELQTELTTRNKLEGVIEMAGAVCHEVNQPLQSISGHVELLLARTGPDDPMHSALQNISNATDRIARLTRTIMGITEYQTTKYLEGKMVDIFGSSDNFEQVASMADFGRKK
jgi:phosphoserine phosphatase RsbU/P